MIYIYAFYKKKNTNFLLKLKWMWFFLYHLYTIALLEYDQLAISIQKYEVCMTKVYTECKLVLLLTPSVDGVSVPGKWNKNQN